MGNTKSKFAQLGPISKPTWGGPHVGMCNLIANPGLTLGVVSRCLTQRCAKINGRLSRGWGFLQNKFQCQTCNRAAKHSCGTIGDKILNHLGSLHSIQIPFARSRREKPMLGVSPRLGFWIGDLLTCGLASVQMNWNCLRRSKSVKTR